MVFGIQPEANKMYLLPKSPVKTIPIVTKKCQPETVA